MHRSEGVRGSSPRVTHANRLGVGEQCVGIGGSHPAPGWRRSQRSIASRRLMYELYLRRWRGSFGVVLPESAGSLLNMSMQ